MEKITIGQFLMFTNRYVPICIEDEFSRYEGRGGSGMSAEELFHCVLGEPYKQKRTIEVTMYDFIVD